MKNSHCLCNNINVPHHRILIVGTQPYNPMVQSRAFDSYFHYWDKSDLRQIFSDSRKPLKGHCSELYQITDKRLIYSRFKKTDPGQIFQYDKLKMSWEDGDSTHFAPKHKPSIVKLMRKTVWSHKIWATARLDKWLDEFKPEIVFLSFSRDFFIFDISMYVAKRYNIPIIVSTADDYIFDKHFNIDPLYYLYKHLYLKTVHKLLSFRTYWMFESNKIQSKYKNEMGVNSTVQHIGTSMVIRDKPMIPSKIKVVRYFGNLEAGRLASLKQIAKAFIKHDRNVAIEIYTKDLKGSKPKRISDNATIYPQVSYEEVCKLTETSDVLLIVESFCHKNVVDVRYSLSTKVADCLASGKLVFAYGAKDTGALSFLTQEQCCICSTSKKEMEKNVGLICDNPRLFKNVTEHGLDVCKLDFKIENEAHRFETFSNFVFNDFANWRKV